MSATQIPHHEKAYSLASDEPRSGLSGLFVVSLLAIVLWFAFVGVFLMIRPFNAPSTSMAPTILNGDYFLVSKFAYGIGRHSLPLSDLIPSQMEGRIWATEPRRGDLAVFKLPKDGSTDYIKRIVGLPGDKIQVTAGVLVINGKAVKRERIEDYATEDYAGQPVQAPQYVETLPDGATYRIVEQNGDEGFYDNTEVYTVPPGHVFAMGDNRDNSTDSRDSESVGFIPLDNLVGRPLMIFFSGDLDEGEFRWDRVFKTLH